jgi:hypothetical protein
MARVKRLAFLLLTGLLGILAPVASRGAVSIEELLFDLQIVSLERTPARDFTLQDLSGRSVALSDYRGRAVMVYFWATW